MTDQAFDDIIKGKLANYTAPVPTKVWEELQFDVFNKQTFNEFAAPVSTNLWDNISKAIVPEEIKEFDGFVQERLGDYIAPVPADMWEKVKPEEEEDKRRFFFWLPRAGMVAASLLLLVMAGAVSAYLYYNKTNTSNEGNDVQVNESIQSTGSEKNNQPNNSNAPTIAPLDDSANDKAQNAEDESQEKSNTNQETLSQIKKQIIQDNSTIRKLQYNTNDFKFIPNQILLSQSTSNELMRLDKEDGKNKEEEMYTHTSREKADYLSLYNRRNMAFAQKTITDNNHTSGIKNVVICPSDRKSFNPDWDVEVFAGPNYGVKSVSANTGSAQYMARKDSSEAARIGFTAGFNIVKPLNDRLLLKTGLQYTQVNEKFTYRTENEVRTTTVVSVRTIIRAPGDTVIVRDTSTVQQIGFKNNSVSNRYRSIDIPVVFGYKFGDDDLSIALNAGVIVNLSSMYQGVILDTSLAPVVIDKNNTQSTYKNNIGLGLYGGVNISKKINYNTYIFAEPFVRYNLSNMTSDNAPFNQRFTLGGLAIGLKFNLNTR